VCSGQSNMQMTVDSVYNASAEVAAAANYPNVRLFTVGQSTVSDKPLDEFATIEQLWSVASPDSVGGGNWSYFSAACWFFGKNLYDNLQIPIGLISSNWGGTIIQTWMSPDALAKCPGASEIRREKKTTGVGADPNHPSLLYNAMISPLLNMRVRGATWYQGEANVGDPRGYICLFPNMIEDWRVKWGLRSEEFSFYFVQLAAYIAGNPGVLLAQTRLAQTVALQLPYVGFATAFDLGDISSPFGDIHPRDKQDIGQRMALSALGITFHHKIIYKGPTIRTFTTENGKAIIHFHPDSIGLGLVLKSVKCPTDQSSCAGFEVQFGSDEHWDPAIASLRGNNVILTPHDPSNDTIIGVRYGYAQWPLAILYNKDGFPAPPFFQKFRLRNKKKSQTIIKSF
jgi:sialate O-acetylesterase